METIGSAGVRDPRAGLPAAITAGRKQGMSRVIKPKELQGEDTVVLARWLLGKTLVRTMAEGREAHVITEVEAKM